MILREAGARQDLSQGLFVPSAEGDHGRADARSGSPAATDHRAYAVNVRPSSIFIRSTPQAFAAPTVIRAGAGQDDMGVS